MGLVEDTFALGGAEEESYAHASGDTAYYNSAGSGQFSVRVAASDTGSGLDQATYPETTSPGGVYGTALGGDYQYQHTYTFDQADTASGTYTVSLQDAIGRQSSVDFSVIRDTTPPTLTLEAVVQSNVLVTWSATDSGSGVDTSTCLLEVREDDGAWQTFSMECGGDDTYDGQPGHTYTFRLSASDNVSNAASTEVEAVVPYVTKYYYANGQRIAMQKEGVVYYVHTDHLGSTSLTTCGSQDGCDGTPHQGVVARQLYHPYGSPRWSQGTLPTDYTFTGQRDEAGLGLMHYGARFYSPRLGRFVSVDTIVPQPGEPQALNRYSYVLDNPLRYTEPTGHYEFEEDPDDPYVWWHDKPANNWIRSAEPVDFPEEFHQPTDAEVAAVVTAPFWAPVLAFGIFVAAREAAVAGAKAALAWAITHPTEALIGKAVAEEAFEAAVTGTPFDPANVGLDVLTQVGDEMLPRRTRTPTWPQTSEEMDDLLGFEGRRIPDGPSTPGRNKVEWKPSDNLTITYEQHPYHPDAPDFHRSPHWHLSYPGQPYTRGVRPGSPIPGDYWSGGGG